MGKGSPAQPHFPRIFAFYDTSSAGSLQGGKNECRFAEVSPRSLYTLPHPPFADRLMFWWWYNWRKLLKHAFGYSYKYRNQARYQKLRAKQ